MEFPEQIIINGYKIIYIKNTKKITSINAYVNTGSIYEHKKESGIAHLLEHVLIDSWNKCSGACTAYWSKKGVISNGHTSSSYTRYYMLGLSSKGPEDMYEYISSIITNPKINKKCYDNSLKAVKDELLIRLNNSSWKIESEFYKSLRDNTECKGLSDISDYEYKLKVLESITIEKLILYYKRWYVPDNIVFTVVTNESKEDVIRYFKRNLKINNIHTPRPTDIKVKIVRDNFTIKRKDSQKTTFAIGFVYNNPNTSDFIYYKLFHDILVGDISSFLYIELRDKLNLIYGIQLSFDFDKNYVISRFNVNCQFENSQKLLTNFYTCIDKFLHGNFDNNLFLRSKDRITISNMNNCEDNTEYLNNFYSEQFIYTGKIKYTPKIMDKKIQTITKGRLLAMANKVFDFKNKFIICETK